MSRRTSGFEVHEELEGQGVSTLDSAPASPSCTFSTFTSGTGRAETAMCCSSYRRIVPVSITCFHLLIAHRLTSLAHLPVSRIRSNFLQAPPTVARVERYNRNGWAIPDFQQWKLSPAWRDRRPQHEWDFGQVPRCACSVDTKAAQSSLTASPCWDTGGRSVPWWSLCPF